MNHIPAQLLAIKAQLYALLATLGAILILVTGIILNQNTPAAIQEQGFCISDQPNSNDPWYLAGKELFTANCAACHHRNMTDNLTGPALGGVQERWADYPRTDLYNWIRHSQQLVQERHPRAAALWQQWEPTVMNDFPGLSDEQIEQILTYIGS